MIHQHNQHHQQQQQQSASVLPHPALAAATAPTSTSLQHRTFEHPAFGSVRVILDEATKEPWFVAKDVAERLGYMNPREVVIDHCNRAKLLKGSKALPLTSSPRGITIIPEEDMYRLIMRSKLPAAKQFESWVMGEVLPQIRKTGGYIPVTPDSDDLTIMCRAFAIQQNTIAEKNTIIASQQARLELHQQELEAAAPKVTFATAIETAPENISIAELAKLIKQGTGYDIGQRRLFDWLKAHHWLIKSGQDKHKPTQRAMNAGLMAVRTRTFIRYGKSHFKHTPQVTGKGQIYFINKFAGMIDNNQPE